jgi:hypothetical protein
MKGANLVNTIEYYIDLRCAYYAISELIPIQITIKEISEIFCCTLRNTRSLLKKMEAEGLLKWEPGKGRGKQSKLTFLSPLSTLVEAHFQQLVQQNDIEQALMVINKKGIPVDVRKRCYQQLRPKFGFQIIESIPLDTKEDDPLDLTLKHMVNEIKSNTSAWVFSKLETKQPMQWPETKKYKF